MYIEMLQTLRVRWVFLVFLICLGGDALAVDSIKESVGEKIPVESQEVEKDTLSSKDPSPLQASSDEITNSQLISSSGARVAASPGVNSSDWLKAILGLATVVALIFAIAWFVKRFTGLAVSNQQQMRIISAIPVGAKERIALIEVADKQLLVGITQHNINLLHSFEEPVVNKNDKTAVDFSSRLQAILSKSSSD